MGVNRANWEYSVDDKDVKHPTVSGSIIRGAQSLVSSGEGSKAAETIKAGKEKLKDEIDKQTK
jgi:hypothetical protein